VARVSQVQLLQTFITLALSAVVNGEYIASGTVAGVAAVAEFVALGRKARVESSLLGAPRRLNIHPRRAGCAFSSLAT
jgi:hypothetical protein